MGWAVVKRGEYEVGGLGWGGCAYGGICEVCGVVQAP